MREDLGCEGQHFLRTDIQKFHNPTERFKKAIFLCE
jgi:hypothetical protein